MKCLEHLILHAGELPGSEEFKAQVMMVVPAEYKFVPCYKEDGSLCGCYTAMKRFPSGGRASCKIHGKHADKGAAGVWKALQAAGYPGFCLTQCPVLLSRCMPGNGKHRVSHTGYCRHSAMRLDMLLVGPRLVAGIEVQGSDHKDQRVIKRDEYKQCEVEERFDKRCGVFQFEVDAELEKASKESGAGVSGSSDKENKCMNQTTVRKSSRQRRAPARDGMLSHADSIALEVVEYLKG